MQKAKAAAERSCGDFLDALASKSPTPGGGGASALVGAIGAALTSMVGNYTVGKEKYADVEEDVRRLIAEAEDIRTKLLALVDEDAEAFEPLSRAYAIPKDDPGRDEVMESCLREAARVPMEILRLSCRAIELHREMAQKGSAMIISDVGTGVVFCRSAMCGAALNVKVNTKLMKGREYAEKINTEADALMEKYWKIADEVYEDIYGRFC